MGDAGGAGKHAAFIAALYDEQNAGIRELCSQPLLLSMICLAYEEGGGFPANRLELYESALNALLVKWDSTRNIQRDRLLPEEVIYRDLTFRQKARFLAEIATAAFEKGEYYFERRRLSRDIETFLARMPGIQGEVDGDIVLDAIVAQHGIFAERARDIFAFSHLTFQEYFTARYIAENEARRTTRRMMAHLTDRRWREVFLLTAGQLEDDFIVELRAAIDGLVEGDATLVELLRWADARSLAARAPDRNRPAL
ncbi:MAG: hypothetical protein HC802_21155, partial [Caldilineaceae bacterium]|nr:hypothetical protein [Caldilineaceae bacterium]